VAQIGGKHLDEVMTAHPHPFISYHCIRKRRFDARETRRHCDVTELGQVIPPILFEVERDGSVSIDLAAPGKRKPARACGSFVAGRAKEAERDKSSYELINQLRPIALDNAGTNLGDAFEDFSVKTITLDRVIVGHDDNRVRWKPTKEAAEVAIYEAPNGREIRRGHLVHNSIRKLKYSAAGSSTAHCGRVGQRHLKVVDREHVHWPIGILAKNP